MLASADADGPPLSGLLWPHESEYVITGQSPVAGALVQRFTSVVITYDEIDPAGPDPAGVREPRRPSPAPGGLEVSRLPTHNDLDAERGVRQPMGQRSGVR